MDFGRTFRDIETELVGRPIRVAVVGEIALAASQDMADIAHLVRLDGVDREEVRGYFVKAGLEDKWRELEAHLVAVLQRLPPPAFWMAGDDVPVDSRLVYDIVRRRPTARAEWLPFTLPQD